MALRIKVSPCREPLMLIEAIRQSWSAKHGAESRNSNRARRFIISPLTLPTRRRRLCGMTKSEVKKIRKKLGLTQKQFAGLIGVEPNSVWRWEAGTHPPSEPSIRLMRMELEKSENRA